MKFKPSDFMSDLFEEDELTYERVAEMANVRLKEWLEESTNAFKYKGQDDAFMWEQCKYMSEHLQKEVLSHRAKLVCIEEIK